MAELSLCTGFGVLPSRLRPACLWIDFKSLNPLNTFSGQKGFCDKHLPLNTETLRDPMESFQELSAGLTGRPGGPAGDQVSGYGFFRPFRPRGRQPDRWPVVVVNVPPGAPSRRGQPALRTGQKVRLFGNPIGAVCTPESLVHVRLFGTRTWKRSRVVR